MFSLNILVSAGADDTIITKQWAFPIPLLVETLGFNLIVSHLKLGCFFGLWFARPGGWQVCSSPNCLRLLSGRSRQVMERNRDGKKSRGSQNLGIIPDTCVPWHRLSLATHYRGRRDWSDSSWFADTDHPSYIYIPTEQHRGHTHWKQSLLTFPGQVMTEWGGSRCAALGAPGLWETLPPPQCSVSHPRQSCWGLPTLGL